VTWQKRINSDTVVVFVAYINVLFYHFKPPSERLACAFFNKEPFNCSIRGFLVALKSLFNGGKEAL
jgi:hypothetical protein